MAKRQFNDVSYQRLKNAIDSLSGLAESLENQKISLHNMPEIHVFGYGSLPDKPHYEPDSITESYLWNFRRDMCCESVRSGTTKFKGLTLGLDRNEGSIVPGAILTYKNLSAEKLCEMLEALAKREVVKEHPIYRFELLQIEKADGTKVMAITCVADPNSAGYHGDGLSQWEKKELTPEEQMEVSLERKARIIAEANGFYTRSGIHATSKSYFDRYVRIPMIENPVSTDASEMKKMTPQQKKRQIALAKEHERMSKLASKIDEHRLILKQRMPRHVEILEQAEAKQIERWKRKRAQSMTKRHNPKFPK